MTDRPNVTNTASDVVARNVVQVGTAEAVHVHGARQDVNWPLLVGALPPRAMAFQPRAAMSQLRANGTQVLRGLGGTGKSQLAADHAHHVWEHHEVDLLVWITADTKESIVSGYASLYSAVSGTEAIDVETAAQQGSAWLARSSRPWLVVLDDLQNATDLAGLWPPHNTNGQTIITTRRTDAALHGEHRRMIDIDVFTPDEAGSYLTGRLGDRAMGADALAAELGHLPLALAQAAAYMLDRDLGCTGYLTRFRDRRRALRSVLPEESALPDGHRATIATTWELSIEAASALEPAGLARPLLEVASFLDPNGIPVDLMASTTFLEPIGNTLGRPLGRDDVRDGLLCLQRLSLATLDQAGSHEIVRVHALVQRATRDRYSPNAVDRLEVLVADVVTDAWVKADRDAEFAELLRANATALALSAGEALWAPRAHPIYLMFGVHLIRYYVRNTILEVVSNVLAATEHHPGALDALRRLASLRADTERLDQSMAAMDDLVNTFSSQRLAGTHGQVEARADAVARLTELFDGARRRLAQWRDEAGAPRAVSDDMPADHREPTGRPGEHPCHPGED